jgi:multiple sugar transport system ATP-binding protein
LKASKKSIASVDAPVEMVEPTGAETIGLMRFGELEVTGRFDPDEAPRMGETITLGIDMSHACLFDPVTRNLI